MLEIEQVFTIFFVTLGPIRLLGPFAQRVRALDEPAIHQIAWRTFIAATIAVIGGGFLGAALMANWHVSVPALTLAGGIVFLLVALKALLQQYEPAPNADVPPLPAAPWVAACSLVFPEVLTPFGIAAVISFLVRSDSSQRTLSVLGVLVIVLAFDLLAMWFVKRVLVGIIPIVLQVLGAVLAVMQVALSVEFILQGLRSLHVIAA